MNVSLSPCCFSGSGPKLGHAIAPACLSGFASSLSGAKNAGNAEPLEQTGSLKITRTLFNVKLAIILPLASRLALPASRKDFKSQLGHASIRTKSHG